MSGGVMTRIRHTNKEKPEVEFESSRPSYSRPFDRKTQVQLLVTILTRDSSQSKRKNVLEKNDLNLNTDLTTDSVFEQKPCCFILVNSAIIIRILVPSNYTSSITKSRSTKNCYRKILTLSLSFFFTSFS